MSEQKAKKLKNENEDLIARWMAQKKQEVDEMNKTLHDWRLRRRTVDTNPIISPNNNDDQAH